MGVKGLWSLLSPVARPIKLETLEGKRLAIDSSIWLYQFQATMRDKEGRVLVNAHVLGFLRRINKLLFHGIKPVFVFDGGAPNLKRSTIAERRRKKAGAAANHAKVAEKLFAAQMRREAVKQAQALKDKQQASADGQAEADYGYRPEEGEAIPQGVAYLEELEDDGPSSDRRTPAKRPASRNPSGIDSPQEAEDASPQINADEQAEQRRKKFRKMDPYKLPELPENAFKPGSKGKASKLDPRLATEEELQHFIEEMRPEDLDFDSPEFHSLPTEVQYEIIGDLRIRSRQQSHKRLASMLQKAPTPLDFSKAQIAQLSQRNVLTQRLLTVTDTIGNSGLQIPVRVASERNREYVLVRNSEAEGGGWVLGVRDQGTVEQPIVVEESPQARKKPQRARLVDGVLQKERTIHAEDDDDDEVRPIAPPMDPHLRASRQKEFLDAIARRHTPKKGKPTFDEVIKAKPTSAGTAVPLFQEDMEDADAAAASEQDEDDFQEVIVTGAEQSLPNGGDVTPLSPALASSDVDDFEPVEIPDVEYESVMAESAMEALRRREEEDKALLAALRASRSDARLHFDAAEQDGSIAETRSTMTESVKEIESDEESMEEVPLEAEEVQERDMTIEPLDVTPRRTSERTGEPKTADGYVVRDYAPQPMTPKSASISPMHEEGLVANGILGMPEIEPVDPTVAATPIPKYTPEAKKGELHETVDRNPFLTPVKMKDGSNHRQSFSMPSRPSTTVQATAKEVRIRDSEPKGHYKPHTAIPNVPVVHVTKKVEMPAVNARLNERKSEAVELKLNQNAEFPALPVEKTDVTSLTNIEKVHVEGRTNIRPEPAQILQEQDDGWEDSPSPPLRPSRLSSPALPSMLDDQDNFDRALLRTSKTPFENEGDNSFSTVQDDESDDGLSDHERTERRKGIFPAPPEDLEEQEGGVDMNAEGDDYARFLSQIKGRNLNEVRQEIDDEIRTLNQQNKVAMRDSEDITHQMVAQIQLMLRLFGIPYITAPMEAEAQCAELARLDLVDGVITDDNDVFLFGGTQCFKNLFNDAKYVECFISNDLDRELSLNRDRLITLAYFLGSDYTIGLPGVGPVVAMELMAQFPGPRGLEDFKRWWLDVQVGKDLEVEHTKFQKTFKKKFSNVIHIDSGWPNPLVRDAYYHPEVDSSDEPFHWGFPDLNGLRGFLRSELSWSVSKVDDELTPIVQRIARRGQAGAMNKQTILDPFFDASLGKGMFAPRLRNNYPSKRLQAVIKAFREAEARVRGDLPPSGFGDMLADLDDEPLKEINPSDSNKLNGAPEASPKVAGTSKRKVSDENEEGNQENIDASAKKKRAPRKRKTNDGDNRSGKKASTSGRRGRGGKVVNTRASSTRSRSTTVTGMEVDVQEGITEMQPVSSPLGGQDYDELFLEIASDPIAPDDLPQRPKPKKRG